MKNYLLIVLLLLFTACATAPQQSLYEEIGGQEVFYNIVDNFITEIEFNPVLFKHFEESNVDRFREKLFEHLCSLASGNCPYTGDNMIDVHTGMNISESEFNLSADLLINAMTKAGVSHRLQNRLLATIVPLRKEFIYL